MICENSYYPDGNVKAKPRCKVNDDYFKDRCPLSYYCTVTERFEQTVDMLKCPYRLKKNDPQIAESEGKE